MEMKELKKFIEKNIVDFSELLLNNYYKLGLDETDAVILIKLRYLMNKNVPFISPTQLSETLSISAQTTAKRLNTLIDKGILTLELVRGENGKERESYSLDRIYELIISSEKPEDTTKEKELVELFETEFKKPLSVLDIQTVTKWLNEDKYTFDQIKDALFKAVKQRRLTIQYVDGILLKETDTPKKVYKKTNLMRDLHKIWER